MEAAGVAFKGGGASGLAQSLGTARGLVLSSHVGGPGERVVYSHPALPTDDGDSGRPARPGVAAGVLLPLPHPHHPALGPAGGAAARTLPHRGEGPGRSWPWAAEFGPPPRAAVVPSVPLTALLGPRAHRAHAASQFCLRYPPAFLPVLRPCLTLQLGIFLGVFFVYPRLFPQIAGGKHSSL